MENVIIVLILAAIIVAAVVYIVKEKKKGKKCIGCPYSGTCAARGGSCCSSKQK